MTNEEIELLISENEHLKKYIDSRVNEAIEIKKEDPENVKSWKGIGYAEANKNALKKVLTKFGLSKDEIKDASDDFDKIIEIGIDKQLKSKDITSNELQQKLIDIQNEYNTYKEEELPKIKKQYESEFNSKVISSEIGKIIAKKQNELSVKYEVAELLLGTILNQKYNMSLENGSIVVKTKENLKPIYGNKVVDSLEDIIKEEMKINEIHKLSNGGNSSSSASSSGTETLSENAKALQERMGI